MRRKNATGRRLAPVALRSLPLAALAVLLAQDGTSGTIVGEVSTKSVKNRQNAVVYIESVPGKKFPPPPEHVLMDQKGLSFVPHVLPLLSGTTVDFRNSDNVMHNVFTPDEIGDKFNLGSWPQGQVRSHTFTKTCAKACEAVMLCNVHPEMEAYIVILTNPYFAVTDEEGRFTIAGVPAGDYTLRIWHARLAETSQAITVGAEDTVTVKAQLTLKR